jgi:hypothetical protein
MDDNTLKIIKDKFDALPESIQEVILSSNYQETLIEIGNQHHLNVEQMGILERETTLVMMGLTPTKKFQDELTRELHIDKLVGSQIATEINEKVFLRIRDLLKLMNTPAGEEPSVDETEEEPIRSRMNSIMPEKKINDTRVLDSAGIKIVENKEAMPTLDKLELTEPVSNVLISDMSAEKPRGGPVEVSAPKDLTAPVTPSAPSGDIGEEHPILAQKLAGAFQIPSKKTEYSLNNLSKAGSADDTSPTQATETAKTAQASYPLKGDPYRMPPE